MKISNTIAISFRSILKNKMRSFLTALGIIIGVGSVIVMVGFGTGSQKQIETQIQSMGTNLIMINAGGQRGHGGVSQGAGTNARLTLDDMERLRRDGSYIGAISPNVSTSAQCIAGSHNWRTQVSGVSADYPSIRNYTVASGAFFTEADVRASRSVVLLGPTVASELFPGEDPLGRAVRINQVPCKVIGVLASKGTGGFGDQDDYVLMPYTTAMHKLTGTNYLRSIFVSVSSPDKVEQAQAEITALLRDQHGLKDGAEDDFRIGSQTEIIEQTSSITGAMTALLGAIAAVSLVVGGIGVMNIMLVSVKERTREIGIRLAVGARPRDVLIQFLIEAFVLSMLGGLMGVLLAFGLSFILSAAVSLVIIQWWIVLLSFGLTGLVGIVAGFFPAVKASQLNPIDSLRYE